uniref:Reverse transcriptase domain-containing protein n=1 Tax=Amphimedon queenslandica TaxID=400682 RepID=A0A1X7UKF2_AMPQE
MEQSQKSPKRLKAFLKPVPSPEKEFGHDASHYSEEPQQLYPSSSLQDGGPSQIERRPEKGRLDDQGGSEGWIFHDPHLTAGQTFLQFSMERQDCQFSCVPFGLFCAPWVITKTLKPDLTLLRDLGVRLVAYIDNILVLAETKELAQCYTVARMYLLQNLGYTIHLDKK